MLATVVAKPLDPWCYVPTDWGLKEANMHTYQSDGVTVSSKQTNPVMALSEIRAKCLTAGIVAPKSIMEIRSDTQPDRVSPSFGGNMDVFK